RPSGVRLAHDGCSGARLGAARLAQRIRSQILDHHDAVWHRLPRAGRHGTGPAQAAAAPAAQSGRGRGRPATTALSVGSARARAWVPLRRSAPAPASGRHEREETGSVTGASSSYDGHGRHRPPARGSHCYGARLPPRDEQQADLLPTPPGAASFRYVWEVGTEKKPPKICST
ncbi:unnamed protein product, partial [Urochloa humidicola]